MKELVWILAIATIGAGMLTAQRPVADAAASPASQAPPKTVTPQSYPAEQIQAGEPLFIAQCGFCHGRDAAGGESGPDLTRSRLVAEDVRGDRIGAVVRGGRADQGMPSFKLSDSELGAIVAFVHDQKTRSEELGGGRRSVDAEDLATGNAEAGRRYFNANCAGCHSPTGDLAGVASRYQGLALLQRMLYPGGRPAPAPPKVTLSPASGQTLVAPLAGEDEFTITILDPSGARQTYEKSAVKFQIDKPLSAHFDQLGKYTDDDMHNVLAYLDTLK